MPASPLRRWLRRHPHPVRLRVDGRVLDVATGANHWAITEDSIVAMSPSRIEALGTDGVVLRAMQFDRDDDRDEQPAAPKSETELTTLARLIAEAHDAGARRHAEAYALAFAENTKLVQILAARLGGLENAWQKAMQQTAQAQADALFAQAQQSNDPAGDAVGAMLATALTSGAMGGVPRAPAPTANGKSSNGAKKGD